MTRLVRLALVLSVLYGTGAHWAALQVYAWGTMKMARQTDPCHVCKIVEKGTASETPLHKVPAPSVDFAVPVAAVESASPAAAPRFAPPAVTVVCLTFPPATPPPDALLRA